MNTRLLKIYRERFVFDWNEYGLWKVVDKKYKRREFCNDSIATFIKNRAVELGLFALRKYLRKRAKGQKLIVYYDSIKAIEIRKKLNLKY